MALASPAKSRLCLIGLDGLSQRDCGELLKRLPDFRRRIDNFKLIELRGVSPSAHVAYSEVLTSHPWYKNGCAGYAFPAQTLNDLTVFSERELTEATLAEKRGGTTASINMPILMPQAENRFWVSDGSLPVNQIIAPKHLKQELGLEDYEPRMYPSIAWAVKNSQQFLNEYIASEMRKLQVAHQILDKRDWNTFLFRTTIFDTLHHLIGLHFLEVKTLSLPQGLDEYYCSLDKLLTTALTNAKQFALVSPYSHSKCQVVVNLNKVLMNNGFAKYNANLDDRLEGSREEFAETWFGAPPSSFHIAMTEGRLLTDKTVAASPVSGAIYINSKTRFSDGVVADEDYETTCQQVENFLNKWLKRYFPAAAGSALHRKPASGGSPLAPEFLLNIDGVEFTDSIYQNSGKPRTTHSANGFALSPDSSCKETSTVWEFSESLQKNGNVRIA